MNQSDYKPRHMFEDEDGNEVDLTEITYEVLATFVDVDPVSKEMVFTHRVRIRPESLDLWLDVEFGEQGPSFS